MSCMTNVVIERSSMTAIDECVNGKSAMLLIMSIESRSTLIDTMMKRGVV